jgi:hypothetical protein
LSLDDFKNSCERKILNKKNRLLLTCNSATVFHGPSPYVYMVGVSAP